MRFVLSPHSRTHSTRYVQLDTRQCEACWRCVEACHRNVITKLSILGHRHALFAQPDRCTGCLLCVKSCSASAIQPTTTARS
ncbi:MAG TPA: ferredoxin family protein [Bacteroidota bacterium]|nr:ferredoxin family protein [Bacteroidota bacterium]